MSTEAVSPQDRYPDDFRQKQRQQIAESSEANKPREALFDFQGAISGGASATDIVDHLNSKGDLAFDVEGARGDGVDDKDIVEHLAKKGQDWGTKQEKLVAQGQDPSNDDLERGLNLALTGIAKTGNDILGAIGIRDKEEYQKRFEEIDKWSKIYSKAVEDNDIISAKTLGESLPMLATLPVALESKAAIFLTETMMGYTAARSEHDKLGSAGLGVVAGALPVAAIAGLEKVVEKVSGAGAKRVLDYYKGRLNLTGQEVRDIHFDWDKVNEASDNIFKDQLRAIIDHAGKAGANFKNEAAMHSIKAQTAIDSGRINRLREVKEIVGEGADLGDLAKVLDEGLEAASENYGKFVFTMQKKNNKLMEPKNIPEELEEIVSDRKAIQELLGGQHDVLDLMTSMPHINNIIRRTKGIHQNKWLKVKDEITASINKSMSEADFIKWEVVNRDMSHALHIKESKIGLAMRSALGKGPKGSNTRARVMEMMKTDKDSGPFTFEALENLVGTHKSQEFEKMIIADLFDNHADDITWKAMGTVLDKKGFVTPEGIRFTKLVKDLEKSFATDDAMHAIKMSLNVSDEGGRTTDFYKKFMVMYVGRLFKEALKLMPGETARSIRMGDQLVKILKNPAKMKKVIAHMGNINPGIKNHYLKMTEVAAKEPFLLPSPKDGLEAYTNMTAKSRIKSKKLYPNVVGEAVSKWIKEVRLGGTQGNAVIESAFKHFDNSKLLDKVYGITKAMGNDKIKYGNNIRKAIDAEAELMYRAIRKDLGLNPNAVDKNMMAGLVEHVMRQAVKDCK